MDKLLEALHKTLRCVKHLYGDEDGPIFIHQPLMLSDLEQGLEEIERLLEERDEARREVLEEEEWTEHEALITRLRAERDCFLRSREYWLKEALRRAQQIRSLEKELDHYKALVDMERENAGASKWTTSASSARSRRWRPG